MNMSITATGDHVNRSAAVAVYGATGYTGRLIARELVDMGVETVLTGRSSAPLYALSDELHGVPTVSVLSIDDARGLAALCASVRTVINAAGPFSVTCEPIARAAVAGGTHYVDISGEHHAIRFVLDDLADAARTNGVALLPASAFYATLSDLIVGIAANDLGRVDDIDLAYLVTDWTPSGAAFVNRLEGVAQPMIQYDRRLVTVPRPPTTRTFDFGPPIGRRRVTMYPAPENMTIPRHVDVGRLRTSMTTSTLVPGPLGRFTPQLARATAALLKTPAAGLVEKLVAKTSGGSRQRIMHDPTSFHLVARLTGPSGQRTAQLSGRGIFDITGPIAARTAARTLHDDFDLSGPLSATEVLDPVEFLDALIGRGITYAIKS